MRIVPQSIRRSHLLGITLAIIYLFFFATGAISQTVTAAQTTTHETTTSPFGTSFTLGAQPTACGTIESEVGGQYVPGLVTMPSALKLSPFCGLELSAEANLVSTYKVGGVRQSQFGDRVTYGARGLLGCISSTCFTIAPRVSTFLRDNKGLRVGGYAIGEFSEGRHKLTGNLGVFTSTVPSATNPLHYYVAALDYTYSFHKKFQVFTGGQVQYINDLNDPFASMEAGLSYSPVPYVTLQYSYHELGTNQYARTTGQHQISMITNWVGLARGR